MVVIRRAVGPSIVFFEFFALPSLSVTICAADSKRRCVHEENVVVFVCSYRGACRLFLAPSTADQCPKYIHGDLQKTTEQEIASLFDLWNQSFPSKVSTAAFKFGFNKVILSSSHSWIYQMGSFTFCRRYQQSLLENAP